MKSVGFLMLCGAWLYLANQIASEETSDPHRDVEAELTKQTEIAIMMKKLTQLEVAMETLAQKLKDSDAENRKLREDMNAIRKEAVGGATYIRWGRRSCQNTNSELVYVGIAVGSSASYDNGGANLLCIPRDPSFGNTDGTNREGHSVVGAEYYLAANDNFPFETTSPLLDHQDMPCSMCQATNASHTVMIPGRFDCYSGWTVEYRGYLMAGGGATRNEFVCVDESAEADIDGSEDEPSVNMHTVEVECGSLPCPPYTEYYELACVVCSQ